MAATPSRRLGLHGPSGGDPAAIPRDVVRLRDQLDGIAMAYDQGPLASRPASTADTEGRQYYATDDGTLYYDFGGGWIPYAWQPGMTVFSAANATPPLGWLLMEGQLVDQARYPALFRAISHVYNGGRDPGGGRFRLPRAVGRNLVGTGTSTDPALGELPLGRADGWVTHRLTVDEMPAHDHNLNYGGGYVVGTRGEFDIGSVAAGTGLRTNWIAQTGGSRPHNNMPPYLALNAWIKY